VQLVEAAASGELERVREPLQHARDRGYDEMVAALARE